MVDNEFFDAAEELADALALASTLLRRCNSTTPSGRPNATQLENAQVCAGNALRRFFATAEYKQTVDA